MTKMAKSKLKHPLHKQKRRAYKKRFLENAFKPKLNFIYFVPQF